MKQISNRLGKWKKSMLKVGLPLLLVPVMAVVWASYAGHVSVNGTPVADDGSWSSEVLENVHEKMVAHSPIPVANACGLGASSCFKCHSGKRADKPSDAMWHQEHASVNHSCVGCHKGNERLMLKNMAHKDLIGDPRVKSEETCVTCHTDGDAQALLDKYK